LNIEYTPKIFFGLKSNPVSSLTSFLTASMGLSPTSIQPAGWLHFPFADGLFSFTNKILPSLSIIAPATPNVWVYTRFVMF